MDRGWRIARRYGKGPGRLMLGFSRRQATDQRVGLRAGLRRFGADLPYRGPVALALLGGVLALGLSLLVPSAVGTDSELLVTFLDAPPEREHEARPTRTREAPAPIQEPIAEDTTPSIARAKPAPEAAPAMPRIAALSPIAVATPGKEADRTAPARHPVPRPDRLAGSLPAPPPVSAPGPRRTGPVAVPARSERVGAPRPAMAGIDSGLTTEPSMTAAARIALPGREADPETVTAGRPDVRGVPLAQLASCLSDRREESLKRTVIARAPEHATCESDSGTYRFVETKNLNAFLMWIERAAQREQGDRCTELALAIDCLERGQIETEARKP